MDSGETDRRSRQRRANSPGRLASLLLLLWTALVSLHAQETVNNASLTGRVTDASGAVVASAAIEAREVATNITHSALSNANGRFRFPYLPVGQYLVTIHQPGFTDVRRDITLTIGAAFDLPVTLNVGATESTIDVSTGTSLLEADRSQVAGTVSQAEISSLPFEGRNYLDLALLLPGVSPTNTASTQTLAETSEVVGQGYSVNSQRNFSNSFVVDGLSDNDDAAGVAGNAFSMDVVQEFQVVTSGGQAEFGRALGGYFNLVTRSGTNHLHGTAYGFLRSQRMSADNALSGSKLPLTQGQYGVSISGPLKKDRTFLFSNFEEGRLNTNGVITVTPANAGAINARLLATGYQAPLLPVGTGPTTRYPNTLHTDTVFVRADHHLSQSDQLSMRYSFYKLSSTNARGVGGLNETSNGTSVFDTNHTFAVSNVATLSPQIFNETRGQFSYDDLTAPPNDQIGPAVTISGVAIFGRSTSSPTGRLNYLGEIVDNLVMQHGAHTLKTGVDFLYNDDSITYPQSLRGSYSFSSLASFLSGTYNSQGYTQNFGAPTIHQNNPNVGFYAQDEWKVSSALTLNAGIRYDLEWLQTIITDRTNVSPRVGLAWSANHGTVVRASYGLFYDRVPLRPLANALLSANNTIDPAQARFLSYSFSTTDVNAPVFPAVAAAPPSGAKPNYSTMDPHIQNPYSQQASLEVEQQLTSSSTLGISYQHLRGLHLISSINTNINLDGTRPDPTRGNIKPYSSKFDSQYDGLAVTFVQRPATWSSVRISYTWSKAIDNVGEFFFSSPINNFDLGVDRGRSDDDQRHRVVFNAAVNSPTSQAYNFVGHITYGWQLSGILQYYSRLPFNITTGANTKQVTSQRPCAPGYSLTANGGLNPCTEALRGAVIGRNAGIGFDFFNLNARLSRTFSISERVKLMGMVEAFNTLNHRNDMIPNATWGTGTYPTTANATFGQATAVGDPRNVQIALRLSF
jgi:Carboxypeptidase regulatory-like domain/TonB dependent receptor